ncbi:glycohydrolase toxin TNT-related protein [Nocardioides yefusunii]|uniref:Glycohydrolase toxin TNT-related protein n=1 Tax=Nocardioides yefusunii TaxID=2500546 RepID=A0ABW1QU77_9ACTN|nr:glycohydrolase toxin TNT-related protein [Nocardioides yefusunii]
MNVTAVRARLDHERLGGATLERGDDGSASGWALRAGRAGLDLGGWDHGEWRTWHTFGTADGVEGPDLDELVAALREVAVPAEPVAFARTATETTRAAALARELMDRSAGWAAGAEVDRDPARGVDVLPASAVKVGTPFDHVGDASGHVLHHFGTSWEERALPDELRDQPVTSYLLVHNLGVTCRAERVPAAHGHPGGAWRVVLDAPIATYVAAGGLRPFVPKAD